MVVVAAVDQLAMQRDARRLRDRVEPVLDQLGVPLAELCLREPRLPDEPRTARNIQRHARQRFVHRRIGGAVPRDPALVAQRLIDRLAQSQRAVLGRVVLIDMEIPVDLHRHVDQRMAADLFDHVIEKSDPRRDVVLSRPVEIDLDEDLRFRGIPLYPAGAHGARYRSCARLRKHSGLTGARRRST